MKRFQCDICKRILCQERASPFRCSACGHGTMRPIKPKAFCCKCGCPIYSNVDTKIPAVWNQPYSVETEAIDVWCSDCTNERVNFVAMLERETAGELRSYRKKSRRRKKEDGLLGIIRNKKDYDFAYHVWKVKQGKENDLAKYSNDDLADARKNKGLSLESLAAYLDISKSYLCKMGRGQKPLSDKAIHFIKEGIIFPKNPKKSLNTMSRTGK